ncbi:hypothetical protein BG004_000989 [Podila humilis]|nr:hypothetical protein BG004_000989 [Podila humilis]
MDSPFHFKEHQEHRRNLAEDSVSYAIFLSPTYTTAQLDAKTANGDQVPRVSIESLHMAKTLIGSIVNELAKDYIWHKDAFSLGIFSSTNGLQSQPFLKGETRFGDCLDDEWMVVFLLREISRRIPGSIIKVYDNDGEFLLIEAADYIPSWLDPDNSDNRVFIFDGELHIIPIALTKEEKNSFPVTIGSRIKSPKLQDAMDIIRTSNKSEQLEDTPGTQKNISVAPVRFTTLANPKIQQAAFGPLAVNTHDGSKNFAEKKIKEQRHYARCRIPVDIARILTEKPELITRACEAFYARDSAAMAACSRMKKFLPTTLTGSAAADARKNVPFITTSVCFTRTCYAQMMGQQFQPPKSFDGIVPPPGVEDPKAIKEAELGMKVTCGFEILCSPEYPGDFGFKSGHEIPLEVPSTKDAAPLGAGAASSFHGHGYHPVEEIERILSSKIDDTDVARFQSDRKDDDDSWMNVDIQVLEDMMQARSSFGGAAAAAGASDTDKPASKDALDMQAMIDKFGEFIQEGQGGVEGAEFLDEQSDKDDDSAEDDDENDGDSEQEEVEREDSDDEDGDNEDDEDIFASDYEDRVANKRAAKKKRNRFMFGDEPMSFDNGAATHSTTEAGVSTSGEGTSSSSVPASAPAGDKASRNLALDHNKFKDILVRTFGVPLPRGHHSATGGDGESSNESDNEDLDDQDLKTYMAELDAELSGTKVGQSFEKMEEPSFSAKQPPKVSSVSDKGKRVIRDNTTPSPKVKREPPKVEMSVEDMLREHTARSRRGFSRQGLLPATAGGGQYGYDPASLALEDDGTDDDIDDDDEMSRKQEARITALPSDDEDNHESDGISESREVVDVDLNLAKNLLESFKSQGGLPGPGGNLLSRLGVVLPRDEESDEEK